MNPAFVGGLFAASGLVFWFEAARSRRRGVPASKARRLAMLGAVAFLLAAWQFGAMVGKGR